jgi:hypothetical protein
MTVIPFRRPSPHAEALAASDAVFRNWRHHADDTIRTACAVYECWGDADQRAKADDMLQMLALKNRPACSPHMIRFAPLDLLGFAVIVCAAIAVYLL